MEEVKEVDKGGKELQKCMYTIVETTDERRTTNDETQTRRDLLFMMSFCDDDVDRALLVTECRNTSRQN